MMRLRKGALPQCVPADLSSIITGGYGIIKQGGIVFSNAALLDDMNRLVRKPRLFML